MHWEPDDLFQKLEFDKILDFLAAECLSELGKKEVYRIIPGTAAALIDQKLKEVQEFKRANEHNDWFPFAPYSDISEHIEMLRVEGYVLSEDSLKNIDRILKLIKNIFKYFKGARQQSYPNLYGIIRDENYDPELSKAIDQVLDDEGNIKPDASPELYKIRKLIGSKQRELDKKFRVIIHQYRSKGWLTDNAESFRNNRRVLSVPAEHKRKIRGIIHDESTTGKTAFIEPEEIIDINNDIFDLETEERREIYRILKELSEMLRPYVDQIRRYQRILVKVDVIQAKSKLAAQMDAVLPKVRPKPQVGILKGFHPLLLLKNKRLNKKTVPFTLTFQGQNRILMLSGPNAGGKSITMKAVGLMQLMLQSGMLLPVDKESEMGIFQKIFADIGDQQSIEDDLSTYSSRLRNMRTFIEHANNNSMILIDEFGSGTDPKIGGAIAESILRSLMQKKVFGVITTHYSNLKIFAFKNKGLVNGSMAFDKDTLSPTYQLKVGRPGSSYAFEIAQKSGLSKGILDYAKHRTGKNEKAVDELLVELQNDKLALQERLERAENKEKRLDQLIKNYETLFRELEFQRKKFKLESKEQALQQTMRENKEIEKVIREIKEAQNLEKAKHLSLEVKEKRKSLSNQVDDIKEDIYYKPKPKVKDDRPIEAGDYVRLKTGGATGLVEQIEKNKAIVQIGDFRMTVKVRDLERANAPLKIQKKESISTDVVYRTAQFDTRIDIRGLRMEEAIKMVESFIDKALMTNSNHLTIIHGKGNGVLRKAVKKKLRDYNVAMELKHANPEDGGDGVTLIEFV